MNEIVLLHNGNLVTTQNIIAKYSKNSEESIQRLIRKHKNKLEVFGQLDYDEVESINSKNKSNLIKHYYLNEKQAYLFMTFLKNTEIIIDFKVALVEEFFEMKKRLENKSSNTDIQIELSELKQQIKDLKKQLILKEDENPFKGFYTPNWAFRKRENEYAYTRKDWMLLLNECERTLVDERQNRKYKQQLLLN
ncbi:Rha family transcriptional regulator [Aliarcobacter butzleri]|uniref:Rha family transcriptional regulator n=1 Tax=Aliarcobacter butzleri TaxID=28197 RepID=UPI00263E96F0|nr:Rha family transcriptional regulator [Aliarcobacter butzleri]MDN5053836.1 Rha family transcriptional regulator [Aliarcobacter butzleri]